MSLSMDPTGKKGRAMGAGMARSLIAEGGEQLPPRVPRGEKEKGKNSSAPTSLPDCGGGGGGRLNTSSSVETEKRGKLPSDQVSDIPPEKKGKK